MVRDGLIAEARGAAVAMVAEDPDLEREPDLGPRSRRSTSGNLADYLDKT